MLCAPAAGVGGEDWPTLRGPRGDGTWQGPKLLDHWPAGGLTRRWTQPIGGGYAGIAVADGRVYTMDRQAAPAEVERIVCLDADTGQPLWAYEYAAAYGELPYGNGPRAAPTLHDGRVYTLGTMGHLHCLDAQSGQRVWSRDCMGEYDAQLPEWGFAASPLIWENLVIVHVGARPDGCFMAFDRDSGRERWRSAGDPAGYSTPILIDRAGGPQLVGWTPKHVLGLSPQSGQVEWRVPYEVTMGVSIAAPICQRGLIFVTGYWEGSKTIRLGKNRSDVALAWEDNEHLRGLMSQPLVRDGFVYSLDKRFGLTCFEFETGRKLWDDKHRATPRDRNPQATFVWLGDDDRVLILNAEGDLILARLSPKGFQELSRAHIIGPTWAHPAYAGQRVYARNDEELVCVELPVSKLSVESR